MTLDEFLAALNHAIRTGNRPRSEVHTCALGALAGQATAEALAAAIDAVRQRAGVARV